MSELDLDLAIAGLAAVTLGTRSFFLAFGARLALPSQVQSSLRYAPVCALIALIVPQVLETGGVLQLSIANPRLWGAAVAAAVMFKRGDMLASMSAGMAVFLLLRWLA